MAVEANTEEIEGKRGLRSVFQRNAPLEVEIGTGKGRFLLARAESHPERDFLGIERALRYFSIARNRAAKRGITNLRMICTCACDVFRKLLPDGSVAAVYALHPDPWPKKRHHKRRLFQRPFLDIIARRLEKGGIFLLQTDHLGYFCMVRELLDADALFDECTDADQALGITPSNYADKCRSAGRLIHRLAVRRTGFPPPPQPDWRPPLYAFRSR